MICNYPDIDLVRFHPMLKMCLKYTVLLLDRLDLL